MLPRAILRGSGREEPRPTAKPAPGHRARGDGPGRTAAGKCVSYRVGDAMGEQGSDTARPDRGRNRSGARPWAWLACCLRGDPARLNSPAGEQVVDIYRRAYVGGGLTPADARRAHVIWYVHSLQSVTSFLMVALPMLVVLAVWLSGIATPPPKLFAAGIYSPTADVALMAAWYATGGAHLHARGVPILLRTLIGFVVVTLLLLFGHQALHLLFPGTFTDFWSYMMLLLPIQLAIFGAFLCAFDIHIDYAEVTGRWTDTPLQRLLPYDKRGKLVFLRASDHYVIVRTTKGEHELRMRFADALDRLGTARGLQVHRSFWVAQDYLATPRKEGRRMVMRVDNVTIPISATYRERLVRHLDLSSQS